MRFAIYFSPRPGSRQHRLGSDWLGRDAFGGPAAQPSAAGRISSITSDARRYGFHATLKPPFHLKPGFRPEALSAVAEQLASSLNSIETGPVALELVDGFLALAPKGSTEAIDALAAVCVREFDGFRLPPSGEELAHRGKSGLTARQNDHLVRWGYPYVFEDFRFHMTLTRRLSAGEHAWVEPVAREHFADMIGKPLQIDSLTIFQEDGPGAVFEAYQRFALSPAFEKADR